MTARTWYSRQNNELFTRATDRKADKNLHHYIPTKSSCPDLLEKKTSTNKKSQKTLAMTDLLTIDKEHEI